LVWAHASGLRNEGLHKSSIELYSRGRYSTVTGNRLLHTPSELAQADVGWLYPLIKANVFDFPAGSKYALLFNNVGEQWKTHYESHSEADLGLCGYLARTLANADDIDAAFRLRGLMRAKWDSAREDSTYGRDTIMKALMTCLDFLIHVELRISAFRQTRWACDSPDCCAVARCCIPLAS
jgi:primase-polymerase (primpol)-like protein